MERYFYDCNEREYSRCSSWSPRRKNARKCKRDDVNGDYEQRRVSRNGNANRGNSSSSSGSSSTMSLTHFHGMRSIFFAFERARDAIENPRVVRSITARTVGEITILSCDYSDLRVALGEWDLLKFIADTRVMAYYPATCSPPADENDRIRVAGALHKVYARAFL